jgi:hypothetical protein
MITQGMNKTRAKETKQKNCDEQRIYLTAGH